MQDPLFVLAFIAFVLFGILDIYYLYLERRFRDNFDRLTRIINRYETSKDCEWIEKAQGNFLKLDASTNFLDKLPHILLCWSNMPYLITFLITSALLVVPLPSK